jgi:hypothetical protein
MERGDRLDQSVIYLLSTLPSEAFLVQKKSGLWKVTVGDVVVEAPVVVDVPAPVKAVVAAKAKPKPKIMKSSGKSKTKKVKK